MSDVTQLLTAIEKGERHAAEELLPLVYDELRRILIENARRKQRLKHGGQMQRVNFEAIAPASPMRADELLALDEALERLAGEDPDAARLVELRFFAGLGHQEAADIMGLTRGTADGLWAYARSWLYAALRPDPQ